jgi:hypothetical protein
MSKISQFLQPEILAKVSSLRNMSLKLHSILPAQFVSQCQIADFSEQQLIIATTSSMWSHQLRYYIPQIQQNFKQQSIRILVTPELADLNLQPEIKAPKHLDNQSADIIDQSAKSIEDPSIKEALTKLSALRKK